MDQENNAVGAATRVSSSITCYLDQDVYPCSKTLAQLEVGDTVLISTTYRITLLTPLMRGLFGNTLDITVDAKEVVRGDGVPDTTGGPITNPSGSTLVDPITSASQSPSALACTGGKATITWTGVQASGYNIYSFNPGVSPRVYSPLGTTSNGAGTPASTLGLPQSFDVSIDTSLQTGGPAQYIAIKSYLSYTDGSPNSESNLCRIPPSDASLLERLDGTRTPRRRWMARKWGGTQFAGRKGGRQPHAARTQQRAVPSPDAKGNAQGVRIYFSSNARVLPHLPQV